MGNEESLTLDNLNIILIGRTGVGKSSLINYILDDNLAKEGNGSPCTKEIKPFTKKGSHLTLYDTPSFGINKSFIASFKKQIFNIIDEQSKTKDANKLIHCIWYCIDSNKNKIEEIEKEFISIFKNIPIIIVLTKSDNLDNANELMRQIELQRINVKYIVPIVAKKTQNQNPFGLVNLLYFTVCSLPTKFNVSCLSNILKSKKQNNEELPIEKQSINSINLIIAGKSGVGKSTLINSVLGVELAETGIGKPITQEINEYKSKNSPFICYDTPGFELDANKQEQLKQQIYTKIKDRLKTKDINQYIHCIWYCIRSDSGRIEETEIEFINSLSTFSKTYKIQIFLILTQCYDEDETKKLMKIINEYKLNILRISPIVAKEEYNPDLDVPQIIKPFGIEELKSFTCHAVLNKFVSNDIISQFKNIKEEIENLQKINILMIGKKNVGRKTLMSKILGNDIPNQEDPDSEEIIKYESDKSCINFFNAPSFDEDPISQIKLRENIEKLINEKFETKDFKQIIHCVWICARCEENLFSDTEIHFYNILLEKLKEYRIPSIIVMTQPTDKNVEEKIIETIKAIQKNIKYIQSVLPKDNKDDDDDDDDDNQNANQSNGIDDLINLTNMALSDSFVGDNFDNIAGNGLSNAFNNLPKINIVAIGKSGVGKSTLINNFFRGHLAATGIGVPVTQRITPLTTPNSPLTIYDTPGLELNPSQQKELKNDIIKLVKDGYKTKDLNKYIHCIWYCISSGSCRFEESEKKFIQELTDETSLYQVPVFIILTQSYKKSSSLELKRVIESENLKVINIIPVVAQIKKIGKSVCRPYGLDVLTEEMGKSLPEALKMSFNNVQISSLAYKRKCAAAIIAASVASSAAVGGSPIPFSDCFLLAGVEVAMLSSITAVYNLDITRGFITAFISCAIGCTSASLIGRTIVVNIIKCIPIAGSIVGGVVGGVTGAILTGALGSTYLLVIEAVMKGEIDPKKISKEELQAFIKPMFKKNIDDEKKKEEKKKLEVKEKKKKKK